MRYVITRNIAPSLSGIDSLFSDFFSDVSTTKIPPVDIYETDGEYVIQAEIAGYGDDDVKIAVKDGVLSISSSSTWREKAAKAREERHMIFSEIKTPEFSRSFILPEDSDTAQISAESTSGILTVRIPRLRKAEKGRIEIKIGK